MPDFSRSAGSWRVLAVLALLLLAGCTGARLPEEPEQLRLTPADWSDLPGWPQDDPTAFLPALDRSCTRLARLPADRPVGRDGLAGLAGDWQAVCAAIDTAIDTAAGQNPDRGSLRRTIETLFRPWRIGNDRQAQDGLFTGYYEASLHGSRENKPPYLTPLLRRPDDLVMVDLGQFRDRLRGERIAGSVVDGRLVPYADRAAITGGALDDDRLALVWVDDPVAAFFLQIQGSGRVLLDDGTVMRIGYAGQNGQPYLAIGKVLIEEGALTRDTVSLQSIRDWLHAHPDQADRVMNRNPSYVFFTELACDGPIGGEGVALTPGRSLAIDHTLLPYGVPVFLDAEDPRDPRQRLQRLMMAQDTGGAIRGAIRGDVFWGYGSEAEQRAGMMKSRGQSWLLLPAMVTPLTRTLIAAD